MSGADSHADAVTVLRELARNLRSAWNHRTDALWEQIDPEMWGATGNPWLVVQSVPHDRLRELWSQTSFREAAESLRETRRRAATAPTWFSGAGFSPAPGPIAFFCMEYAVSEALPIYSGGLGNVAGDYLKAASDLGVPLVGVGLLYQQGYFRQAIDAAGEQREFLPFNDISQLPVAPARDGNGTPIRVRLPRGGPPVWLRAWEARVGHVPLYLLDSNDPANTPADRGITSQLYGGDEDTRLLQEMALGIGGWRVLRAVGLRPDVCHLNEGHAALAAVERAREYMLERAASFDVAVTATQVGNLFTTHTPAAAGFDRFPPRLIEAYLGAYLREEPCIGVADLLALGRADARDEREPLSMAWLSARMSGAINAVSRRHEEVSRRIFQVLFPRMPLAEVPVGHVTNGVHVPSWDSAASDALWTARCGADRWNGTLDGLTEPMRACQDTQLWAFRAASRSRLVDSVRERLGRQLAAAGLTGAPLEAARHVLDPDVLTIAFARRFTDYKRPGLLLHDAERLARLLKDRNRPVQLVVAGKAHPRDEDGKRLVQEWIRFVRRPDVRASAVFLADYDLRLAEELVQGADIWVNTPGPPWEACGTSGMKVLVNGGVNLSVRDGWWAEAYRPEVGWVLESDGDDAADAGRLYDLLEREVVPSFHDRDVDGIPAAWVARLRASMAELTPTYSANRTIREYTERYYVPASTAVRRRGSSDGERARDLAGWKERMRQHWPLLRFGGVRVQTDGDRHAFQTSLYLDDIDPQFVRVELYADGEGGEQPSRTEMARLAPLVGAHGFVYAAEVPATRPAGHFTPRATAIHPEGPLPIELPLVTWAR